ncbi:TetR/AcrR family transcriptional regulator [Pseudonocardia sp. KRD-184]|uniref:TetR/AcrR family transcriptional regulator n=1 Tax=Pseudonocardia oceani TaxID=2792013 RepID=A0ABS6U2U1_9PSEU|nr:TetR/AcrR family transcriptional regulator [Pseudonocardia oceani]MBW0089985.1 TetR/AcrR family transcriptional regulator [Pseudonocardia oceani]MBW0094864.1 TetR/AcrR family transcriptional regulator [Pseudonocardia oceani]MBW0108182.1 TetR/AcrR family transcriptional regulator [Pseudonocardia oceani]MBW0120563.1 TetR/AcrR family transcriptional regulator [Pseudonocardia oceani]MBW0126283.1 TetR/AcrR family transcriptional regulator [Pseudonocardia oceani]
MAVVNGSGGMLSRRKSALLQAAADLFAAKGYHAVSTDDIGRAVGISGPGVYRHFASKVELLTTLCDAAMDHLLDGSRTIVERDGPRPAVIARLVEFHVQFAANERALLAVYLREQRELPVRELRQLRRRQREYESVWCGAISSERSDLAESDVRAVVKVMLSMLNGTAHIRDGIPRARLVGLLEQLAAGALGGVGIDIGSGPAAG